MIAVGKNQQLMRLGPKPRPNNKSKSPVLHQTALSYFLICVIICYLNCLNVLDICLGGCPMQENQDMAHITMPQDWLILLPTLLTGAGITFLGTSSNSLDFNQGCCQTQTVEKWFGKCACHMFLHEFVKVSESVLTSNPGRSSSFGFQFGLHKTSRLASLAQKREWWQVRSTSRVLATTPLIKI